MARMITRVPNHVRGSCILFYITGSDLVEEGYCETERGVDDLQAIRYVYVSVNCIHFQELILQGLLVCPT